MGVIDRYVAELDATLVGSRRAKADLVTEARDGLIDASEAYAASGWDAADAERRAVAEFGTVAELAPAYQRELAAGQSRRTAVLICLVLAPQHLVWALAGRAMASSAEWRPPVGYAFLSNLVEALGAAALIGALLILVAIGLGTRYRGLARLTGTFAAAVATTFVACGLALTLLGPVDPLSLTGLPWATAFLLAPMGWIAIAARRTLASAPRSP